MAKHKHKDPYKEINEMFSTKSLKANLMVPSNLRVLCAILEVKPEKILHDFMWTLSVSYGESTPEQRAKALEYFLQCGYGQELYTKDDILQMFKELEAKRLLMVADRGPGNKFWERHIRWTHMYIEYWFEKWFYKVRKKGNLSVLKEY